MVNWRCAYAHGTEYLLVSSVMRNWLEALLVNGPSRTGTDPRRRLARQARRRHRGETLNSPDTVVPP
jgi:hypothetical protein